MAITRTTGVFFALTRFLSPSNGLLFFHMKLQIVNSLKQRKTQKKKKSKNKIDRKVAVGVLRSPQDRERVCMQMCSQHWVTSMLMLWNWQLNGKCSSNLKPKKAKMWYFQRKNRTISQTFQWLIARLTVCALVNPSHSVKRRVRYKRACYCTRQARRQRRSTAINGYRRLPHWPCCTVVSCRENRPLFLSKSVQRARRMSHV